MDENARHAAFGIAQRPTDPVHPFDPIIALEAQLDATGPPCLQDLAPRRGERVVVVRTRLLEYFEIAGADGRRGSAERLPLGTRASRSKTSARSSSVSTSSGGPGDAGRHYCPALPPMCSIRGLGRGRSRGVATRSLRLPAGVARRASRR